MKKHGDRLDRYGNNVHGNDKDDDDDDDDDDNDDKDDKVTLMTTTMTFCKDEHIDKVGDLSKGFMTTDGRLDPLPTTEVKLLKRSFNDCTSMLHRVVSVGWSVLLKVG